MRVIYVNLFSQELISGGIKVTYRCAEILQESGYNAMVWQPGGKPVWLQTTAPVIAESQVHFNIDDILIFPESFTPVMVDVLKQMPQITKLLFSQSHFNIFNNSLVPPHSPYEMGFKKILCVSHISKGILERAFAYDDVAVMPVAVNGEIFRPRPKTLQIAFAPRKLLGHAIFIQKLLMTKYPEMSAIPWKRIEGLPEAAVAEIMGSSAIYLALGQFESCPLMPLEAMSAGCAVVGFHGLGGLEYATPGNGCWHYNDDIEKVVDDLYRTIIGIQSGSPEVLAMISAGQATAAQYNTEAMRAALIDFIESAR